MLGGIGCLGNAHEVVGCHGSSFSGERRDETRYRVRSNAHEKRHPIDPVPNLDELRAVLADSGYSTKAISQRLQLDDRLGFRREDRPVLIRRLGDRDSLHVLLRLFFLNLPVGASEAGDLLGQGTLAGLLEAGVLESVPDGYRSRLRIVPAYDLFFAYDAYRPDTLQPDSVLGWTSAGRTLASITVRNPVARALDVGTGSGVQALLAAGHADRVVAVDLNPRALWLTQLNCSLNGIANVECREGDLYQPVEGESFGLVVANPPFVISPSSDYLFRDGGLAGDELSRRSVAGAAEALEEGGFAHVMCNWVRAGGETWFDAPARWVRDSGCDALLMHYDTLEPLKYAAAWNDHLAFDEDRYARTIDEWVEYYRRQGIESLSMGAVVLRRRSRGPNWVAPAELLRGPTGSSSNHVLRMFAARDLVESWEEGEVLRQAFRPVEGHRLEQVLTYRGGEYHAETAVILLDDGIGLKNRVDPQVLHVLLRMDGHARLEDLIRETAEDTGMPADALKAVAEPVVRELFGLGLLEHEQRIDPPMA